MKRIRRPSKLRPTVNLAEMFRTLGEDTCTVLGKGEDFDCAASTAAQIVREEWRRLYGDLTVTVQDDTVLVCVDPGKAQRKGSQQ